MNTLSPTDARGRWSTASFGEPAGPSADEIGLLGEHLHHCRLGHRLSMLACAAQDLRGFIAARLFTSLALGVAALGLLLALIA